MVDNDNLRLWREVEETDPSGTRASDFEGRTVTSINGTYVVKQATKLFGPIGAGWGYEITEERFDKGGPILDRKEGTYICDAVMHTIKLTLWYMDGGERRTVTHFGHTPYVYGTSYGPKTDMEAPKKSLTDAVKKCLSMVGFSADVFLGMFDDVTYVEAAKVRESVQKADDQDAAAIEARANLLAWMDKEIGAYAMIPNTAALKLTHTGHIEKLRRQCDAIGLAREAVVKLEKKMVTAYQAAATKLMPDAVCTECGIEQKGRDGGLCSECGGQLIVEKKR